MKDYDVLMKDGWWAMVKSDNEDLESSHATEEHATERATRLAQIRGGKVTVQNDVDLSAEAPRKLRVRFRLQVGTCLRGNL